MIGRSAHARHATTTKWIRAGGGRCAGENRAVTNRSPSFRPSVTSVLMPSLMPVLIGTAIIFGCSSVESGAST